MADVENESTAERDRWQSKQSQVMRGGEALWRRRQPDHVLQGKHGILSSVFDNSMAAALYRKAAVSASRLWPVGLRNRVLKLNTLAGYRAQKGQIL